MVTEPAEVSVGLTILHDTPQGQHHEQDILGKLLHQMAQNSIAHSVRVLLI